MITVWLPIMVASVAGSLHCAAMCGPFVAAVTGVGTEGRARPLVHAAYHLGRLATYLGLGAAAGTVGKALDLAGSAAGIGRFSAFAAGALLIVWGGSTLALSFAKTKFVRLHRRAPARLATHLGALLARFRGLPPLPRAAALGLSTTLVPCGWLYAFVATAAGSGGVAPALGIMLAFWLGTVPALLAAGFGMHGLFARLGRHARAASAALIVLSGVLVLTLRVGAPSPVPPARADAPAPGEMPAACPLHRR